MTRNSGGPSSRNQSKPIIVIAKRWYPRSDWRDFPGDTVDNIVVLSDDEGILVPFKRRHLAVNIHAGDWIVNFGGRLEVVTDKDFHQRFSLASNDEGC